jgi:two-component system sensor histidine kinase KdpD
MTRQLSELSGEEFLARTAGRQLAEIFTADVVIYLREADGSLAVRFGENSAIAKESINHDVAQWVVEHGKYAGAGTDTLPSATALFVPMTGSQHTVGAVGVRPHDAARILDPEQQRLLESCASLIALSLERDASVLDAHQAQLDMETEKLRSSLLSAVSHDIRTPLAGIAGASSTLARAGDSLSLQTKSELLRTIKEESERLSRLVENLLQMTRLSSGKVQIDRQWHPIEEIIGSTLTRMERALGNRIIETHVDSRLSLIHVDAVLIEQLLVNLIENATKYSPPDAAIEVSAREARGVIELEVTDRGRGFAPGDEKRVFDLFYRGSSVNPDRRGTGIGLAICRAIAEVHGGRIKAANRPGGGALVSISLPHIAVPPPVNLQLVE